MENEKNVNDCWEESQKEEKGAMLVSSSPPQFDLLMRRWINEAKTSFQPFVTHFFFLSAAELMKNFHEIDGNGFLCILPGFSATRALNSSSGRR